MTPGTLFVVATPIGNLEDITLRALRVLGEVDLVAAEDTRRSGNLLRHYKIETPLLSLHEHNEAAQGRRDPEPGFGPGNSVALVSDAGTPGVSDPGATLVRAVAERGLPCDADPWCQCVDGGDQRKRTGNGTVCVRGFPAISSERPDKLAQMGLHAN